ncbi:MAG: VCBS repeat-containing protein [Verrucomicrobia bacterium]|nr:VCBS repeat-containing protein [Verrucomicrobiota bacterium]
MSTVLQRWTTLIVGLVTAGAALAQFTRITSGTLVNDHHNSWGLAVGDYDNDGMPDVYVANGSADADVLYRNTGTLVAFNQILLQDSRLTPTAAWADWDNDGELDLFVPAFSQHGDELYSASYLMAVGHGEAAFPPTPPLLGISGYHACGGWADFNEDGYLDLYIGAYRESSALYYGDPRGGLRLVNGSPITLTPSNVNGCGWADYDNDGDMDLFVANSHAGDNALFRNDGGAGFVTITEGAIVKSGGTSIGVDWGDYDNDGDLDLVVANGANSNEFLYRNEGNGEFVRIIEGPVVSSGGTSFSVAWGDCDNDGDLDLFVANNWNQPDFLFENQGDGTFVRILEGEWVNDSNSGSACAWVDFDNDGFLDLFIANGHENGTPEMNSLYRNEGNDNAWMMISLIGTASNRSAIGARVRAWAHVGGREVQQLRHVRSGGDPAQKDLRLHFGLGDATKVDVLRIEWPSGIVQELKDVPANQILAVTEPPRLIPQGAGAFQVQCWINQRFDVQASTELRDWTTVATVTNLTGMLVFEDVEAGQHESRYYRVVAE